ncbi:MAG: crossover junction endodeoxyribonuclease RuvC [Candidatus Marinamargulisbacteria bacterium]|jgi:crossover junction endodeoxyribonuclease RuvC
MIILGIDPGLAATGFGAIRKKGNKFELLEYGTILTKAKEQFPIRLTQIYEQLDAVIKKHSPGVVAIEDLFFNKNVSSALSVGHARGVIVLKAAQAQKPIYSYTPLQVKSAVCGYGFAEKKQVQYMVQKLLNLKAPPKPDHAADAIAVAICHAHSHRINSISS